MISPTNGHAAPGLAGMSDAAPKGLTGWTDPGIDEIIADPNLTAAAKLVAVTLIRQWAWFKSSCFPSDQTIAKAISMSPGHVQRCLCELEQAGYIRRERTPRCRIIWLLWRCDQPIVQPSTPPVADPPGRPVAQPPSRPVASPANRPVASPPIRAGAESPISAGAQSHSAPARNEPVVSEPDEGTRNVHETSTSLPSISNATQNGHATPLVTSAPVPPATSPMLPTCPVRPILEELKSIRGADAGRVRVVANRLAAWLMDMTSLGYYLSILAKAAAGLVPIEALVAAFQAATRSKESARHPGAIWVWTLNNWVKPPLPSQINQPVYCTSTQAPAVIPSSNHSPTPPPVSVPSPPGGVSGPAMAPMAHEEEIKTLREILMNKRSPFAALAQLRLKEMGASAE
jgi:hypothetical protein